VIDLHTHLLPGVDDGADTPAQSISVLNRFASLGVTAVACTPHLRASEIVEAPCEEMDSLLEELRRIAPAEPRLVRGFEIMLDQPDADLSDPCLGLGGTRYRLVEFGRLVPAQASVTALRRLVDAGLVPVLAHPERYAACSVEQARAWRETGALLQVDATTIMADTRRAERARDLLTSGLATILASDNHGDGRNLAAAVEWLDGHGGSVQARALAFENPAALLADAEPAPVPPLRIRRSWYTMFKDFVVGGQEA
jgi:protein-tyrosine phosphatase